MASLPLIDLSPFLESMESIDLLSLNKEQQLVADQIKDACANVGFFVIKNHGVSIELMKDVLSTSREFFGLPSEEKEKIHMPVDQFRGYQKLGENVTKAKKDYHEAIDFYREIQSLPEVNPSDEKPLDQPPTQDSSSQVLHHLPKGSERFIGSNFYPEKPERFKAIMEDYISSLKKVGKLLVGLMGLGLGLKDPTFMQRATDDTMWVLRVIGYPPLANCGDKEVGISCGEHTDYGCLTFVNQDDTKSALQVMCNGEWIFAEPIPGTFVCNIGDMVEIWSNGKYKSTLHRVVNSTSYRISTPFFFEPNLDVVVKPLTECVEEGQATREPAYYAAHLLSKVTSNFTYSSK